MIGAVVDSKLATLHELESVYGLEDLCNLYEIIIIRVANEQTINEEAQKKWKGRR